MNEEWKTTQHRRKMTEQIERMIQNPNRAREIEKTSFNKAKTREEYVTLVKNYISQVTQVPSAKKENMVNIQQDAMMAMQNLPNRGQGLAGNQQLQMTPAGVQGLQQNLQGQQPMNIQQNQLNMIRQKQFQQQQQQQQQSLHMHLNQHSQQQQNVAMQQQQPTMTTFNPNMNQAQQILRAPATFTSPTGQPPQNPMAPPAAPVFPGQPTPPQHQPGMVPSPAYAQQMSPAGQPGSQQVLSPATYIQPSPSPQQSMPSPIQRAGVPSPSTSLNTPGNPSSVGSVPSPGSAGRGPGSIGSHVPQEEQIQLREKQRQLANYVEQCKKQLTILKEQGDSVKAQRIAQFIQHLTDISKSNDLAKITQRLHQFSSKTPGMSAHPSSSSTTTATSTTTSTKSSLIFQPLLNAINEQINSPHLNHNLQKAYGPALNKLHGTPSSFTAPILKKPPSDSPSSQGIPDIVQGEVARLPPKFQVSLDPGHLPDSDSVHLLCKLEDEFLPSVPPVCVVIPERYPSVNPQYNANTFYCQTHFHQLVHKILLSQLSHMPDLYTFTQLMDAWEMSVRMCCQMV